MLIIVLKASNTSVQASSHASHSFRASHSCRASHSFRASRKMPRSPRLAHKAPIHAGYIYGNKRKQISENFSYFRTSVNYFMGPIFLEVPPPSPPATSRRVGLFPGFSSNYSPLGGRVGRTWTLERVTTNDRARQRRLRKIYKTQAPFSSCPNTNGTTA